MLDEMLGENSLERGAFERQPFPTVIKAVQIGIIERVNVEKARVRLGPRLAPLSDFRFSDHLVWGLIAGLVIVVVPGLSALDGLGANLLVVFGTLYALRGMGIALWFLAPGRLVMALLIAFSVLFLNVVGVLALGLGLGDTWLDWRRRASKQKS